jgi:hypothetical protein
MKSSTWALALTWIVAGSTVAAAQPDPLAPVPPADPALPEPQPEPPRPPQPQRSSQEESTDATTGRPEGWAIGIGLGYLLPTSLETPNTTSVRLRLASGLTFEPQLTIANTTAKTDNGATTNKDKRTELSVSTVVRLPVIRHNKVELEALGSAGIGTAVDNPNGSSNNTTTTTFAIGWGLAVNYWHNRHLSLSLSAGNPLISVAKTTREQPAPLMETSTSTTSIGLIFDPTVAIMIHLFN